MHVIPRPARSKRGPAKKTFVPHHISFDAPDAGIGRGVDERIERPEKVATIETPVESGISAAIN
jgi:hypothetical protein